MQKNDAKLVFPCTEDLFLAVGVSSQDAFNALPDPLSVRISEQIVKKAAEKGIAAWEVIMDAQDEDV